MLVATFLVARIGRGFPSLALRTGFCWRGSRLGGNGCAAIVDRDDQASLSHFQCQLDGFGQARSRFSGGQPVDHDFDRVPHLTIELQVVVQRNDRAVDAGTGETLLEQIDEQVAIFAFLGLDQRGQTTNRVPSGSRSMRSMICSRVCAVIGREHCGQWPWPVRANSTRR